MRSDSKISLSGSLTRMRACNLTGFSSRIIMQASARCSGARASAAEERPNSFGTVALALPGATGNHPAVSLQRETLFTDMACTDGSARCAL